MTYFSAPQSALSKTVRDRNRAIVSRWLARVKSEIAPARALDETVLIDHVPAFLDSLASSLAAPEDGRAFEAARENAKVHGARRASTGYSVSQVISDYVFLREALLTELQDESQGEPQDEPRKEELLALSRFFETAIGAAVEEFTATHQRKDASENLKSIADAIPTLVIRVDSDFRYVFVNRSYEEWTGRSSSDVIGKKVDQVVDADVAPTLNEMMARALAGERMALEHQTRRADGVMEHMLFTFVSAHDANGQINGVVITGQSIEQQKRAEIDARERKHELTNAFSQAPTPIALLMGPEHVFALANPPYVEFVGKNPTGLKARSAFPGDEGQALVEVLDRVYRTGQPSFGQEIPFKKRRPNGKWIERRINTAYHPYRSTNGEVAGVLAFIYDVTEQVRARAAIEASETRLRSIFGHAAVGFAVSDLRGHFLEVNPRFCEITGYSVEELKERTITDIVHEDDLRMDRLKLEELTGGRVDSFVIEKRFVRKDGSITWVRNSVSLVPHPGGEPLIVRVAEDVTAVRESEERLRISQNIIEGERHKFTTLVNESTMAIAVLKGEDLVYEVVNKSYQKIVEGRELTGRRIVDALPELADQEFPRLLRAAYDGTAYRETEAFTKIMRASDGALEDRYFDQSYTQILGEDGRPYGVFIQALDVTEQVLARRKIEEVAQRLQLALTAADMANAAKSAFLANMSHEIRTPLGAIMGFVSLMKDDGLSPQQVNNYISVIERNSVQLMRIIDDILDLSKVEAGMMVIEHIDFSLVELLSDFASLMGFRAREKGVLFELKAMTELPDIVNSDPTRIRQILTNIVGNAIKFTDRGSVALRVSYLDGSLRFEVVDTGRGITEEQATKLFQPFSQGDASTTRKYGGTGLGLALTRRLSEALGGSFELASSRAGEGSTFVSSIRVRLPEHVRFVRALGFASEPIRNAGVQGLLRDLRVLLVEDSPDNQALFSIYLNRAGAKIDIASDGQRGVEMALSDEYDIVLMDVQMPIMDGITAVRRLRSSGYETPIIALTAHAMKEEKIRCLEAGYTGFLSKPIQRSELVDALVKFRPQ
jgi:PAS domain S-box-containing protein